MRAGGSEQGWGSAKSCKESAGSPTYITKTSGPCVISSVLALPVDAVTGGLVGSSPLVQGRVGDKRSGGLPLLFSPPLFSAVDSVSCIVYNPVSVLLLRMFRGVRCPGAPGQGHAHTA